MKGILAVWIVWVRDSSSLRNLVLTEGIQCTFAVYERLIEGIVSLFIPFYDEFKSLFMLFLILTRARVSPSDLYEPRPVTHHVIREPNQYSFILYDQSSNRTPPHWMEPSRSRDTLETSCLPSPHSQSTGPSSTGRIGATLNQQRPNAPSRNPKRRLRPLVIVLRCQDKLRSRTSETRSDDNKAPRENTKSGSHQKPLSTLTRKSSTRQSTLLQKSSNLQRKRRRFRNGRNILIFQQPTQRPQCRTFPISTRSLRQSPMRHLQPTHIHQSFLSSPSPTRIFRGRSCSRVTFQIPAVTWQARATACNLSLGCTLWKAQQWRAAPSHSRKRTARSTKTNIWRKTRKISST